MPLKGNSSRLQQAALRHLRTVQVSESDCPYLLQLLEWFLRDGWGHEVRTNNFDPDVGRLKEALEELMGRLGPDQVVTFILSAGEDVEEDLLDQLQKAKTATEAGGILQEQLTNALNES